MPKHVGMGQECKVPGGFRDAGSPGFDTARGMGTCSVVVSNS